jgi:hypothetical protein
LIGFAFHGPNSIFAVKGSRAVTHFKRLLPGAKSLKLLLDRSRALREHLGPILWQLPPTLKKDSERLQGFLQTLDREIRHAVEFRHPSWLSDDIFQLLNKYQVAPSRAQLTGDADVFGNHREIHLCPVPWAGWWRGASLYGSRASALGKIPAHVHRTGSLGIRILQQ